MAWRLGVGAGWGKCDLGRGQGTSWRRNRETWWLSPGKEDTAGDEADEIRQKVQDTWGPLEAFQKIDVFLHVETPSRCLLGNGL